MIIGENRRAVIENIRKAAECGEFHQKVELTDPVLSPEESRAITAKYLADRTRASYRFKKSLGVMLARRAAALINRQTGIRGLEKIPQDLGGVLITSNHFSPLENTVIRHLTQTLGRKTLGIISQTTNFAMTGAIGFLMNYADTIPVSADPRYLAKGFFEVMRERLVERQDAVLLYPEQEMWFHYRKPRPPKSGAYFFASKLNIPILSCFVEMIDCEEDDTEEFRKVRYVLHILGVLYPDPNLSVRENTEALGEADYALKKACYETAYGKPLTYEFDPSDIAGWKGSL